MWMNDQKCDAFEIAKRMAKTNQEINGQQCIRNDDVALAASDEVTKIA